MDSTRHTRRPSPVTLAGIALLVALLVAMALNTKFLTPEEVAAANPKAFDPTTTAEELFAEAPAQLAQDAAPLADVVLGLQQDIGDAAEQFGAVAPNRSTFVFVVTGTGVVQEVAAGTLQLEVDGVPLATTITVPTTTAINGAVLRDVLGFRFGDAPDQSNFQFVGDELKTLMQQAVAPVAKTAKKGDRVTVVGAISVVAAEGGQPAAKPVSVQPVSLEVGG